MLHEYFPPTAPADDSFVVPTPPDEPYLRVIPLGGCGEVGRNMTAYETNDDIVVIDAGVQFPEEEMLGVDLVINDLTYLIERKDKVRALLLTHAHEDHVGGVPYFLAQLDVPVYGTDVTLALLRGKLKEHKLLARTETIVVDPGEEVTFGSITARFVHITHSIFGNCSIALVSPFPGGSVAAALSNP